MDLIFSFINDSSLLILGSRVICSIEYDGRRLSGVIKSSANGLNSLIFKDSRISLNDIFLGEGG